MLEVFERLGTHCHEPVAETITLNHDQRNKGRIKAKSLSGTEVRIFLERGNPLLVGEYLKTECGKIVQVEGAVEDVAHASCDDWHTFARACYHLGNRHVKIEVGDPLTNDDPTGSYKAFMLKVDKKKQMSALKLSTL